MESIVYAILLVAIGLGVVTAALDIDVFVGQQLNDFRQESTAYDQYQALSAKINTNEYVANGVVFTVWAISGLILFNTMLLISSSERSLVSFIRLVLRGGEKSRGLIEEKVVQSVLRIGALISLIAIAALTVSVLVPLIIVLLDTSRLEAVIDYIVSISGVWICLVVVAHATISSLRFLALRRRLLL